MMRNAASLLLFLIALLIPGSPGCAAPAKAASGEVPRMQVDVLKSSLGDPSFVVIDVRQAGDFQASQSKIKGAIREKSDGVADWAKKYSKAKTIVLYCA